MIPIAGVLLLIVVVFTVAVVVSNPGVFNLSIFGASVPVTAAGLYLVGAGAMLVLILAAALLRRGIRRELRRRRQVKTLRTAANGATRPAPEQPSTAAPNSIAASSATARTDVDQPTTAPAGVATQHARPVATSSSADTASAAERQALLDEAEELTGDSPDR